MFKYIPIIIKNQKSKCHKMKSNSLENSQHALKHIALLNKNSSMENTNDHSLIIALQMAVENNNIDW